MIVILDRQHAGKRSSPNDVGATFDLDGDGVRGEAGEREIDLTAGYIAAAAVSLRTTGHTVHLIDSGDYDERHLAAIKIAKAAPALRCAYIACHVNAGGGKYGLIEYDVRSIKGAQLADELAFALGMLEVGRGRTKGLGAADRGWVCIGGIYAGPSNLSGVIYEPFFCDYVGHRPLMSPAGLVRVGHALADGCTGWGA